MLRLRRQYNLATLMTAVLALAVDFAWVPWPASGLLTVAIVIPLIVSGFTLVDWLVIYGIVGVYGALMLPVVANNPTRRNARRVTTAPPSITAPQGAPNAGSATSGGPEVPDG